MGKTTKRGNVILSNVEIPDRIEPGEAFEANATVKNGAAAIGPFDPDRCGGTPVGYKISVEFDGPGFQHRTDGPKCHSITSIGANAREYSATFIAPDFGDEVSVSAEVVMGGSGKRTGEMSDTAALSAEPAETPSDPGDDVSGGWFEFFDGSSGGGTGGSGSDGGANNPLAGIFDIQSGLSTVGVFALLFAIGVIIWETQTGE